MPGQHERSRSQRTVDGPSLRPDELRAFLERTSDGPVEVRETHISWVLMTPDSAYKLKKPFVLPFLDYGTPERRRQMCQAEVRLNRRLAKELYVGVRGAVPTPEGIELAGEDDSAAIDYLVQMRRYDERQTAAERLERGELRGAEMASAGRALAGFHADCPPTQRPGQGAWQTQRRIDRNLDELIGVTESQAERERIRVLARFLHGFLSARSETFDARAAGGLVREGHGDLRSEHVVLPGGDGKVMVVDCAEFDDGLRTLDVADDLAFLVMDLTALGGERFAGPLLDAYRDAGGDCGADSLLAFFAVHRALIRAKVMLVRSQQHPEASPERAHASAQARELLAVAERFSWRARLPLAIVVCGRPASGKSHLASALASRSHLPLLSSDSLRKALAGISPTERADADTYSEEFSRRTYAELGRRAAGEIATQGGVVLDATFRRLNDRTAFAAEFNAAAPPVFVQCAVPADVLAQRAALRQHDPGRVSDATPEIVQREGHRWEPLDEVMPSAHLCLRTDRPIEAIVADVMALLDGRLDPGSSRDIERE